MAGTLFGLGLSQQHDGNGLPMAGCLLYVYDANTSTPATTYKDSGLTAGQEHPFPIEADANGRIPMFWVADGTYRARLTNAAGVEQFDEDNILAIGPSSGEGGGGGGVDATAIFATGDVLWRPVTGTRSGWVRANARTIGSATSGASERANADCQPLFELLWNTYSNTICPVSSGRGASAAADWAANKTIGTLDMRGRAAFGVPDMGNSDSGRITSTTVTSPTSAASTGGAELITLTSAQSGQKAISAAPVTINDPTHSHGTGPDTARVGQNTGTLDGGGVNTPISPTTLSIDAASTGITASFTLAGSDAASAHNNMPPAMVGSWYLKLALPLFFVAQALSSGWGAM